MRITASGFAVTPHTALQYPDFARGRQLAVLGGTLGVVFAIWGIRFLTLLLANGRENFTLRAELNWHVLLVVAGLSLLTGVLFGIAPAVLSEVLFLRPPGSRSVCPQPLPPQSCWNRFFRNETERPGGFTRISGDPGECGDSGRLPACPKCISNRSDDRPAGMSKCRSKTAPFFNINVNKCPIVFRQSVETLPVPDWRYRHRSESSLYWKPKTHQRPAIRAIGHRTHQR